MKNVTSLIFKSYTHIYLLFACGARCWDAIRNIRQNRPTLTSWRLPCYR